MGILPIRIQSHAIAIMTLHRLKHTKKYMGFTYKGNLKRPMHVAVCEDMSKDIPELLFPCDNRHNRELRSLNFAISIMTADKWAKEGEPVHENSDILCYTDGSRHDNKTGAAYLIISDGEWVQELIPLGEHSTVFQAEVVAINHAAI